MQSIDIYLEPTEFFDYYYPGISKVIKGFTEKHQLKIDLAVKLFYFVRDNYHYSAYEFSLNKEHLKASYIFNRNRGWCLQKAILLTTLGRAAGIPSRLIIATIRNHKASKKLIEQLGGNIFFPHAYTQFYLDGRWVKAAATFDTDICTRIGVPLVEFDGINDAILPGFDLNGQPFIEYLEDHGCFNDVPWEMIYQNVYRIYGSIKL